MMLNELIDHVSWEHTSFRHVIVDEAQLFTPTELTFIRHLAPKDSNDLFFCEDRSQSIRRGAFQWNQVGVDVRNRSFPLSLNYRTTEQIWNFAKQILEADAGNDKMPSKMDSIMQGPDPELVSCSHEKEEIGTICIRLRALIQDGFLPHEIAIIARDSELLRRRGEQATRLAGLRAVQVFKESRAEGSYLTLTTMENAIGLEFRGVIVIGCEAETHCTCNRCENDAFHHPATPFAFQANELYIACTRARERLILTSAGPMPALIPQPAAKAPFTSSASSAL